MTGFTRWIGVLLALPGMAAIVLPFSGGASPLQMLREEAGLASSTLAANAIWLALPFFVAPMILDWQLRRARAIPIGRWRALVCHAVAVAAIASVLVTTFRVSSGALAEASPAVLPVLAAIVVYGALVARCLGRMRPADETAGVAMNSAYLPNAILCLVAFGIPGGPGGLQVGAWMTLVAGVCSIVQIVLVMRAR